MANDKSPDRINGSKYTVTKSGSVRQAGQLVGGDGSITRGSTARAGTLGSDNTGGGDQTGPYKPSFAEGTRQKFRPTPGKGKVK